MTLPVLMYYGLFHNSVLFDNSVSFDIDYINTLNSQLVHTDI